MNHPEKNASDHPLPGSVSNQNGEQAEPGHDDGGSGGGQPPEPDKAATSGGESGEGSQSTGHPDSAG